MFYNIIPLLLILISGLVIARILVKKFPAVATLDISSIPQEKEKQVKQKILRNRLKRNINRWFTWLNRLLRPLSAGLGRWGQKTYQRLLALRDSYSRESAATEHDVTKIDSLFLEAENLRKNEQYTDAEKCYIEIISLDSKNITAFKKLGELYIQMQKIEEAKETFEHVLKLTQEDAEVYAKLADLSKAKGDFEQSKEYYLQSLGLNNANGKNYFDLAEIYISLNNVKEAVKNIKEALKIEPKNPRYLDAFFEISILNKDKAEALDAYKGLKEINPENQKLPEMKKAIDEL